MLERWSDLIDFVEKVEGRRIALLDGEDERHGDQRLLAAAQLVHVLHFGCVATERNCFPIQNRLGQLSEDSITDSADPPLMATPVNWSVLSVSPNEADASPELEPDSWPTSIYSDQFIRFLSGYIYRS